MKKKAKRKLSAMTVITWQVLPLVLILWLLCMVMTTWGVAKDLYRQLDMKAQDIARRSSMQVNDNDVNKEATGYADYCRINFMEEGAYLASINKRDTDLWFLWEPKYGFSYGFAMTYRYQTDGQTVLQSSDPDYLYFSYLTPEEWAQDAPPEQDTHYLYINQSLLDQNYGNTNLYTEYGSTSRRLTGWFEGNEFHPVKVECIRFSLNNWSSRNNLIWKTAYEAPVPAGQELVTIYSIDDRAQWGTTGIMILRGKHPITIDGTQYDTLSDVLDTNAHTDNLRQSVVRGSHSYVDAEGNTVSVRVALCANPLEYAMDCLRWFYAVTLILSVFAVHLILRGIQKHLTASVIRINDCIAGGMKPLPEAPEPRWQESFTLEQRYREAANAYHDAQTKTIQLQTALDYARNAENHRRKMISGITHELKTPLAVIHSYAEGLSEGIAAEKQEQYLNVILQETRRMDGMVLEMLDLSRLEAGKVRLSADQFSLLELTRTVMERLSPMAQERQLQIHYTLAEEFLITADESRMEQVITNFATNAIKYTPEGGNIWLRIYQYEGKTNFILTNECAPLPEAALEQIWDSFYRVEESRTTKGTGLGLSIARAIIELHGGSVYAQNTSEGVEFRFVLP